MEVAICTVRLVSLVVIMGFSCVCDTPLVVAEDAGSIDGTPLAVTTGAGVVEVTLLVVAIGAGIALFFRDGVLLLLSTFDICRSAWRADPGSNAGIFGVRLSKICTRSLDVL